MEKKFLFSVFIFSLFFFLFLFGNVLAVCDPTGTPTSTCGNCGIKYCICDELGNCDWGPCIRTSERIECGICGFQYCICDPSVGECNWGECEENPMPATEKDEKWTGYKCGSSSCGGQVLKADCITHYTRECKCIKEKGDWQCSPWKCTSVNCENTTTTEVCEYWQVCAIKNTTLKCNDQKCWMEKNIWETLPTEKCKCDVKGTGCTYYYEGGYICDAEGGYCKEEFSCNQNNFSSCQPNYFQREQLSCQCWGQCLDPVVEPHYYDGQKELPWRVDCSKFPKKWQREECEILNREGIKLPVKFGWDMPGSWQDYWASSTDSSLDESVWSLKLIIERNEIFLTHDYLLNTTKFKNPQDKQETKYEKLNRLLTSACPSNELLSFLRIWDSNPLLDFVKLTQACYDRQRLNQILYFIYFVEGMDPVGKPGGGPGVFTYSISQDKGKGPCSLAPGINYQWKVKLCCQKDKENCGPPDPIRNSKMTPSQAEKWNFRTHAAPEPVGILEAQIDDWWKGTKKECFLFWCWDVDVDDFVASAIRWIDTDWNGPETISLKERNFIDFEWCKSGQYEAIRSFYEGKVLLYEPLPGEREIEERKKEAVPECENPNFPCPCKDPIINECLCGENYSTSPKCKRDFLGNIEICHPTLVGDSTKPRLKWNKNEFNGKDEEEIRWEIKKRMEENCGGYLTQPSQGIKLGNKKEEIWIDENPYYPIALGNEVVKSTETPLKNITTGGPWKWDFQLLDFPLFLKFFWQPALGVTTTNIVEGQKIPSFNFFFGQKWNFVLEKEPIKEWEIKPEKGELIDTPPIKNFGFYPPTEKTTTTISGIEVLGFNRLQFFTFSYVKRTFSVRVNFINQEGKRVPILLEYLILRKVKEEREGKFIVHQVWPCLDGKELNQIFTLTLIPCFDEWGENCKSKKNLGFSQKIKSTGEKPTNLTPPPPSPKKLPTYLDWEPVAGAASYFFDILTPEKEIKEMGIPQSQTYLKSYGDGIYKWKIKSCADNCKKEEFLQCGSFSDQAEFYGCELNPPQNFSPKLGEQFFPNELNSFSWDAVDCQGPAPFYQYRLEYVAPVDCKTLKKELRDRCNEIQGNEKCKNLSENKIVIPVTTLDNNFFSLSSPLECLGTYYWQIRACLDKECQEAGDWSPFLHFYVVLEKIMPRGGGKGFGTCKNIIPCTDCKFSDIPKIIANILSCLLWTVSPIAIVFLLLYTGIGIYFSFGDPGAIEKAKSIWKAVGIGFLIMLLSWTIVNLIGKTLKMPGW